MSKGRNRISHLLSRVLRHSAVTLGLNIRSDGYVLLSELLSHPKFRGISEDEIGEVVASNDKQRFKLTEENSADGSKVLLIRANQGHTIKHIREDMLLERLADPVAVCVHGTELRNWEPIRRTGLCRMERNNIHMATGLPSEAGVISGMRRSSELLIYIDMSRAMASGIPFYLSSNGVVLTPGVGSEGYIPPEFFRSVIRVADGVDLLEEERAASAVGVLTSGEEKEEKSSSVAAR